VSITFLACSIVKTKKPNWALQQNIRDGIVLSMQVSVTEIHSIVPDSSARKALAELFARMRVEELNRHLLTARGTDPLTDKIFFGHVECLTELSILFMAEADSNETEQDSKEYFI
jgi:hypothetical protein